MADEPQSGPSFIQVPMAILHIPERELNSTAKLLYGRLALFARKTGRCNPSHETLGREIGVSPRQVRNLLAELQQCGLVAWTRTGGSSRYDVRPEQEYLSQRNRSSDPIGTGVPITRGSLVEGRKDVNTKADSGHASPKNGEASPSDDSAPVALPPNWTPGDLESVVQRLSAFMEGERPPADVLTAIVSIAMQRSLLSSDIQRELDAALVSERPARPEGSADTLEMVLRSAAQSLHSRLQCATLRVSLKPTPDCGIAEGLPPALRTNLVNPSDQGCHQLISYGRDVRAVIVS